jgi:hypothetical protein
MTHLFIATKTPRLATGPWIDLLIVFVPIIGGLPPLMVASTIEKRPGSDWIVEILLIADDELSSVTVYGAQDEAEASRDGLASFAPLRPDEMKIISVTKL